MAVEFHAEKATYFFETMIHVFQKNSENLLGGVLDHFRFRLLPVLKF